MGIWKLGIKILDALALQRVGNSVGSSMAKLRSEEQDHLLAHAVSINHRGGRSLVNTTLHSIDRSIMTESTDNNSIRMATRTQNLF
jgi:hypothetical protein